MYEETSTLTYFRFTTSWILAHFYFMNLLIFMNLRNEESLTVPIFLISLKA